MELGNVETLIDLLRNGFDLRVELLLDGIQIVPVAVCDQVDGQTQVTEPSRAPNTMEVCFSSFGEVEVDDDIHGLYVYPASEQVSADEVATLAVSEVVEDSVSVGLLHLAVYVEARVTQLSDLLGQQFNSLNRVAENYALVDLELRKYS